MSASGYSARHESAQTNQQLPTPPYQVLRARVRVEVRIGVGVT